ncbi:hypothetical protein D7X33_11795 [Butyricicoccus sp. 1XD8-22]|nr:hypothetical protein D7X33_11795 [Butyricicoccus sp. 1XD8-22]
MISEFAEYSICFLSFPEKILHWRSRRAKYNCQKIRIGIFQQAEVHVVRLIQRAKEGMSLDESIRNGQSGRRDRMTEPIFESSLTAEEIERNFQGTDFFAGIMVGVSCRTVEAWESGKPILRAVPPCTALSLYEEVRVMGRKMKQKKSRCLS